MNKFSKKWLAYKQASAVFDTTCDTLRAVGIKHHRRHPEYEKADLALRVAWNEALQVDRAKAMQWAREGK